MREVNKENCKDLLLKWMKGPALGFEGEYREVLFFSAGNDFLDVIYSKFNWQALPDNKYRLHFNSIYDKFDSFSLHCDFPLIQIEDKYFVPDTETEEEFKSFKIAFLRLNNLPVFQRNKRISGQIMENSNSLEQIGAK